MKTRVTLLLGTLFLLGCPQPSAVDGGTGGGTANTGGGSAATGGGTTNTGGGATNTGGGTADSGIPDAGAVDAGITLAIGTTWWDGTTTRFVPGTTLEAFTWLPDGGYGPLATRALSDGGYEVTGDASEMVLRITDSRWAVRHQQSVDLTRTVLGRPGLVSIDGTESVLVTLSGLTATTDPYLQIATPAAGFFANPTLEAALPSASTLISDAGASLDSAFNFRPTGTEQSYVTQLIDLTATDPDVFASVIDKSAIITGFSLAAPDAPLVASLTQPPLSTSFRIVAHEADVALFENEMIGTTALSSAGFIDVTIAPRAVGAPNLWVEGSAGVGATFFVSLDGTDTTIEGAYRDPYPVEYGRVVTAQYTVGSRERLAGTTSGGAVSATLNEWRPLGASNDTAIRLSPPRALTIDGAPARTAGTLNSLTPVIAWSAPSRGIAEDYEVVIYELTASGAATVRTTVAYIAVDRLQLRVPPGLLQSGHHYLFKVGARFAGEFDLVHAPGWANNDFDFSLAEALTTQFQAP